ncbi:protein argonaute 16-like [Iris pallida]|uniref:Protein argonaute 16-like n=1 Tax=Iris pallida TaxID=29817 RepID=A0AAX6GKY7_IRIPA|nr:protein argonaute 16-like [Iris pallida]
MASPGSEVGLDDLPPPPPTIPPNVVPSKDIELKKMPEPPKRHPMARPGVGRDGRPVRLLSNHFRVKFNARDAVFYHYSVSIKSQDKIDVEGKGLGRKVIDKLHLTYGTELAGKDFAYDGEKSLFTVGALPQNKFEFTVILEESSARTAGGSPGNGNPGDGDRKRSKRSHQPRIFKVEINFAAKIPMRSITEAIEGREAEHSQDALRVLDIILRQQQAKRGCLLVRQSFFNSDVRNYCDLGGGVTGCRGFHSSFRTTNGGLSLNMDVSTTMIMTPGPVLDFLLANQNIRDARQIDWTKAKRMLKNMRIQTTHNKMEFKIIGISDLPCNQQCFPMKVRDGVDGQTQDITVYDYFYQKKIELTWSAYVPCLDVGKPKRPNYLPVELCCLLPLQRYTKALSSLQRASLVEKSRQKPQERIRVVTDAVQSNRYDEDPMLKACGISIEKKLTEVDGRVLAPPKLKFGNNDDTPRNGRWNFNNKRVLEATTIERWAIVNFSARCDMSRLSRDLINCARTKGIQINGPHALIEEDRRWNRSGPVVRVEKMFEQVMGSLPGPPQFLLCVLPERKNSDIYGPWKKKNLHEIGIVTQCIAPTKLNDQYLTNVLLKINSKLGGVNSLLAVEHSHSIPLVNDVPTLILGMDVSHGSPGRADIPSIAAVVGSRCWPRISRYRASVRTQSPKVEMIDCLYKPQANGKDDGIIRELLMEFYNTSHGRKPSQVIIFRDGVSESQFNQVLNIELNQICKAFHHLGETMLPKFTVIVAQKNHHTKLFQAGGPENVQPGTVVDTKVVHPRHYDFYMCAHAGMIGTSRPTHYHVLLDEIGFSPDDLQQLVHSLSYVYQRSTTAISTVAPVCYAHLAAAQVSQFIKFEDFSETSSGHGGVTAAGGPAIPELPPLHENVRSSMFFC